VLVSFAISLAVSLRTSEVEAKRSYSAKRKFRHTHPCPATGSTKGPCKDVIDHVLPLCADDGGEQIGEMSVTVDGVLRPDKAIPVIDDRQERSVELEFMRHPVDKGAHQKVIEHPTADGQAVAARTVRDSWISLTTG
jgi:hypothetical protein